MVGCDGLCNKCKERLSQVGIYRDREKGFFSESQSGAFANGCPEKWALQSHLLGARTLHLAAAELSLRAVQNVHFWPLAVVRERQLWVESYRLRGTATGRFLPVATGSFGSKAASRDRLLSTQGGPDPKLCCRRWAAKRPRHKGDCYGPLRSLLRSTLPYEANAAP